MKMETIPLATATTERPVEPVQRIKLTRREWLKGTGVLFGTLAVTSILAGFAPSHAWALEMTSLDTHQGQVLLALVKRIYPHQSLDDAVYALVVKDLDKKAVADKQLRSTLAKGVQRLDAVAGGDWSRRGIAQQDKDVAALAGSPFFDAVRSTAVVSLYSNPLAYAHFGYGGSDGDGGYLHKGFNNLSWLPDPPAPLSGPVPSDN
ncbi:tat (twin-arginine translocation) pathway signal sequence [Burkholderia pseudomultivorans]|uniref:Gluconate 2-dehydrogenase subunit 3 family protein n=2 Tax=Burkholderia cepacia complex TaxID=87882 RepID=A0AAN0RW90_9BURK|nr:gluconate 2-dehydrogenase subunit 3 family protein [Burkholderia cenocepacia]AOI89350.1 tat (twin-arginine translocation) pathway signal sequence [Burkholderia pseudomultivorans]KWF08385.1 tat (twin-arginine translocation) pathway signal sequence [Burkholderia pseudomultivorans]